MPADHVPLRPGDRVRAWGVLVRDKEGDWFQPPLPVPLMYGDLPVVEPHWRHAVRVVGADFASLASPRTAGPRVQGAATVTGRWTGDAVEVEEQSTDRPPRPSFPSYRTPPCPAPPGGWPRGTRRDLRCDDGGLRRSGVIVAATRFRPSPTQAVLVVAANDLLAAEAQLRLQLGDRLCVVLSRCSRAEFAQARRGLEASRRAWLVYESWLDPDAQGQPSLVLSVVRLLPDVLEWLATTPAGLVTPRPWLAPAAAS